MWATFKRRYENDQRLDLQLTERHAIEVELRKRLAERHGGDRKSESAQDQGGNSATLKGKSRDLSAEQAGFRSTGEARAVEKVVNQGVPALQQMMDEGWR